MVGTGEIKYPGGEGGGTKLALLPCSSIMTYQGLEEENLDQKSPGPPGGWLMQQASSLLIEKRKLLESLLEIIVKWAREDVETLYSLLNKKY